MSTVNNHVDEHIHELLLYSYSLLSIYEY